MFQNLIFNAPKSSYTKNQVFLYEYKKQSVNKKKTLKIPFMWIKSHSDSQKLFIYFHANSTDIGQCVTMAENLSNYFQAHVILMEYRGYGISKKQHASEKKIYKDTENLYKYIIKNLNFKPENVNVIGRSLGSAFAIHLCQKFKLGSLTLISPFLSIRKVVKDKLGFLSFLVKDLMKNEKKIDNVKCPVLIIHGKKDKLVKPYQAQQLFELIKTQKKLSIIKEMTHNNFSWYENIFTKIDKFLENLKDQKSFLSQKITKSFFEQTKNTSFHSCKQYDNLIVDFDALCKYKINQFFKYT